MNNPAYKPHYYTVCRVQIFRKIGPSVDTIMDEYVLINSDEKPADIVNGFNRFKAKFEGLATAEILVSSEIDPAKRPLRAQRFRGFDRILYMCPNHPEARGAFCQACGRRLYQVFIVHSLDHLIKRGYPKK